MLAAIGLACALLILLIGHQPASAAVVIEGDEQSEIEVSIESEPLAATIDALATKFGVETEGIEHLSKADPMTGSFQGSFKDVIARLLKNWNHVIVLEPDDPARVEKIIILNDSQGSRPPASKAPAEPEHTIMP